MVSGGSMIIVRQFIKKLSSMCIIISNKQVSCFKLSTRIPYHCRVDSCLNETELNFHEYEDIIEGSDIDDGLKYAVAKLRSIEHPINFFYGEEWNRLTSRDLISNNPTLISCIKEVIF